MKKAEAFYQKHKQAICALLLVVALHLCFFAYAAIHKNIYLADDSQEYLWQAYNLKHSGNWYGGDFSKPYDPYLQTRRPPFYGMFIYAVKLIYNSDLFVCFIQNLLSIFSIMMSGILAKKLWKKVKWYLIPLCLLFFPTQFIYANRIMADVLFQFLLVLAFWFFLKFEYSNKKKWLYLFSGMIALATLTKPVLYLFAPILILLFVWLFQQKKIPGVAVFSTLLPLVVILLLSCYNLKQTGYFHFSSGNNMMVYHYYSSSARFAGGENHLEKSDSVTALAKSSSSNLKEFSHNMSNSLIEIFLDNPVRFSLLQVNGMLQFFIDHGRWDIESFFVTPVYSQYKGWRYEWEQNGLNGLFNYMQSLGWGKLIYLSFTTIINIIMMVLFIRFLRTKKNNSQLEVLLFILTVYIVMVTGFVGCSRYKMALYPFILLSVLFYFSKQNKKRVDINRY